MDEKGKKRFMMDVDKFVVTRLRQFSPILYNYNHEPSVEKRFELMDELWERHQRGYKKTGENWLIFTG